MEPRVSSRPERIIPAALQPGDTIGIVSPSWFGGEAFVPRARRGIATLESLGYRVKVAPHAFNTTGHVSSWPGPSATPPTMFAASTTSSASEPRRSASRSSSIPTPGTPRHSRRSQSAAPPCSTRPRTASLSPSPPSVPRSASSPSGSLIFQ